MSDADTLGQLREAVRLSPKNVPLRLALGDALLSSGQAADAEAEFRAALQMAPENGQAKLGLARAFFLQGRRSHALVLLEDHVRSPEAPGRAHVLYARLLSGIGEAAQAAEQYRTGVQKEPGAADPELAERLGVRRTGPAPATRPAADADDGEEESDDDALEAMGFEEEDFDGDGESDEGRLRAAWGGQGGGDEAAREPEVERPRITFADVGGMESLKEEIRLKIIHPLAHADLFKAYGKAVGGGILLYGPPGCGKTHLARATAGEIKAGFIAVGIHDVLDMWIGNSERNLHQLFAQARRNAPCVLFFDEVDALGASRSDMKTSAGRHLINQFLSELDGVKAANDGVLVLGATNAPWHLDSAFRRPGRFDRILFVPPPDAAARAEVLRVQLRGKPQEDLDADAVARKTEGFSGADLKAVVDMAVESKLREAMKTGVPAPLRTRDLLASAGLLKPTTREWFATARNYALYANQGGTYDEILKYLKL